MSKFLIFKIIFVIVILFAGFYLLFPNVSSAQLVPCGRSDQNEMCTLCHLIIGIKGIIDYIFRIMVIFGIVMIMIAGVVYIVSSGNEGMMTAAKNLLKNALVGFAIILGAWLIINTILWIIGARGDLGIQVTGWNTFTCSTTNNN